MTTQPQPTEPMPTLSSDGLAERVAQLRKLFPEVFVEGKIDFEKLKAILGVSADLGPGTQTDGKPSDDGFPAVGTPEWGLMNQRRAELIRKKNRQGLSPEEQAEYERLQRLSRPDPFPLPDLRRRGCRCHLLADRHRFVCLLHPVCDAQRHGHQDSDRGPVDGRQQHAPGNWRRHRGRRNQQRQVPTDQADPRR